MIRAYETLANSHETTFELPTLIDDSQTMQLSDMEYGYTIEIDLGTLRQIVKMSTALRSDHLQFSVWEPSVQKDMIRTTFTIKSVGDATQSHSFNSAIVQEEQMENTCIIRAATDVNTNNDTSDMVEKYADRFSAQYLNHFLKSMERQIITMKLSKEKPLIIHYPLGAENSFICFVLAPKTNEA